MTTKLTTGKREAEALMHPKPTPLGKKKKKKS
jgi:hypothetical protein